MIERFTGSARHAVVLAQEEARTLGHQHVGGEHLLLGLLLEPDGTAGRVLAAAGVTAEAARAEVTAQSAVTGQGEEPAAGLVTFTAGARKILELSLREALEQGKRLIGSEHLLLALLRDADGPGARALERLGGPLPALRQRVLAAAENRAPEGAAGWEAAPVTGASGATPLPRLRRQTRAEHENVIAFRELLAGIDQRLAGIEARLGIEAGEQAGGKKPGLRKSVEQRLGNIERHLGLPGGQAAAGGGPPPES